MLEPFLLQPACKDYLWGGTKLKTLYGKKSECVPLAETWECSIRPDGPSMIANGKYAGWTLEQYLKKFPDALGTHGLTHGGLPVLVKLIDAEKDLPVQVHFDDACERLHESQREKTKMWYILCAEPGATLVYGFAHNVAAELVRRAVKEDQLLPHLQMVPVHAGDVFQIEPGMIHAIGGGVLLAEVQNNAYVTYRVYDYGRRNKNGELCPLQIDEALPGMNFRAARTVRQQQRIMQYTPGMARELLARCRYFQVERLQTSQSCRLPLTKETFLVLLVTKGKGSIKAGENQLNVKVGETVFIPAQERTLAIDGDLELLSVHV